MQTSSRFATLSLIALIAGCAGHREPAPANNHPASPTAAETPPPKPSTTLRAGGTAPAAAPEGGSATPSAPPVAYTCPHHPRVMQAEAGDCPMCGMTLEPTTSAETSPLRQRDDNPTAEPQGDSGTHDHGGHP